MVRRVTVRERRKWGKRGAAGMAFIGLLVCKMRHHPGVLHAKVTFRAAPLFKGAGTPAWVARRGGDCQAATCIAERSCDDEKGPSGVRATIGSGWEMGIRWEKTA